MEQAPDVFRARFETTSGPFMVEVTRAWAPHGADRFYELVTNGFYNDTRIFRVVSGFVAQFGIHANPSVQRNWVGAMIPDDPPKESNLKGTMVFAKSGPNTRTTQIFINLADNRNLDGMGFAPFGKIVEGADVPAKFYRLYGDAPPGGVGPIQARIQAEGNAYLDREFPRLDRIQKVTLVQ